MKKVAKRTAAVLSTLCLVAPVFATSTAVSAATPVISNAPRIVFHPSGANAQTQLGVQNSGWESTNWSGYAISGSTYGSITGSWTVPTVSSSKTSSYSSTWIGIDGYSNSDLIQTGTEQDYYSGSAHYQAWWEILPAAETPITSMTVRPGDKMTADIQNLGGGKWSIEIQDVTENETFTTTQSYSGPGTSAEWIQEAPTINGRVATLANYGEVSINPTSVNGGSPGLVAADSGAMVNSTGTKIISDPSNPNPEEDGFNVAYGSTAPAAPTS